MKLIKLHHQHMASIIKAGKAVYAGDVFNVNSFYDIVKKARKKKLDIFITISEVKQIIQWFNYSYNNNAPKYKVYKYLTSLEFALIFGVEDDVVKYLY